MALAHQVPGAQYDYPNDQQPYRLAQDTVLA